MAGTGMVADTAVATVVVTVEGMAAATAAAEASMAAARMPANLAEADSTPAAARTAATSPAALAPEVRADLALHARDSAARTALAARAVRKVVFIPSPVLARLAR